ncbi:hypothetical protein SESBI_34054, partial [Sesbania bispinosa]
MATPIDVSMNPKPPDDGGSSEKDKATFRDTLLGSQNGRVQRERVDLIGNNLFRIKHEEANLGNSDNPPESLHGEWMVVTRSKKSAKQNGKGKVQ